MKRRIAACSLALVLAVFALALAQDKADLSAIYKIKDEGLNRSQVMDLMSWMTDVYGPRLAGSPEKHQAEEWVMKKLSEWGFENVHTEKFSLGRSWQLKKFAAHMMAPVYSPLIAYPKAWTPGTNGPVRAEAVRVDITSEADFDKYKGKLRGLYVLTQAPPQVEAHFTPLGHRYSADELADLSKAPEPGQAGRFGQMMRRPQGMPNRQLINKITEFFVNEGVAAVLEPSSRGDGGTLLVASGGERGKNARPVPAQVVVAVEHYNRICRILEKNPKIKVELEMDIQADFIDSDLTDNNVIADFPGTDKKDEIVMLGGHFDSWHSGTGAADNAAGSAVAMEAIRILKAAGLKPRRTVRVALWGAEEEGLLGSRGYVNEHFASRPSPPENRDSEDFRSYMQQMMNTPPTIKPDHAKLAGYFNYDNGTGKIRGIYLQGNEEVRPIFEAWLEPFKDMGATTITIRNTGGTDHQSFDAVGLPGFQFIQDEVEYGSRTHHFNMDVYDRIQRGDLMQSAVIMASFVYHTAMRDQMLPRKPMPGPRPRPSTMNQ
jgi:carboxypeptidase Q